MTYWPVVCRACLFLAVVAVDATTLRSQGFSPQDAVRRMRTSEGLRVDLVAAEPLVRQPVAIDFDDRGRLWVVQYLQYPNPAGLKRVEVDRYSRTIYDRVPEPPPHGPRGDDRITILEDTNGDGHIDTARDFIDGLNLATGLAFGYGGVFVLQVPYLLFYPDRDGDDVPDGNPEVLLEGFGMEDAASVANSLTWGPDGWLYGNQGTCVTANIRGIEFQQGVWRYHPVTKQFELFCEGGPNMFGFDYDRHGRIFTSNTFGSAVAMHAVPGGYYVKAFGKHGPLHNPYTFGYFDVLPHANFRGGHVTSSGIIYQGHTFPPELRGTYIGANLLAHELHCHTITPVGSSFKTAHGGEPLVANDTWFAPTFVALGPDGAVYIADWYDKRTAHPDPDAEWDRTNGRIYRIQAEGADSTPTGDLSKLSSDALVDLLSHPNDWHVRKARRLLAERGDASVLPRLRALALGSEDDQLALQALWTLSTCGGFDDEVAQRLLGHRSAAIRGWTVRLVAEDGNACDVVFTAILKQAQAERSATVRSELASAAQRLPAAQAVAIVERLLAYDEDVDDPHLPLLVWWAIERHAEARDEVLSLCGTSSFWLSAVARHFLVERLGRRYAATRQQADWQSCARLVELAPDSEARIAVLSGIEQGLHGVALAQVPEPFLATLEQVWNEQSDHDTVLKLALRLGHPPAREAVLALVRDASVSEGRRIALLGVLSDVGQDAILRETALGLWRNGSSAALREAALSALSRFSEPALADRFLEDYSALDERLRDRVRDVLVSRHGWATALVAAVEAGRIDAAEVSVEQVRQLAGHDDAELEQRITALWGRFAPATPEEKLAVVRRLNNDLNAGRGDPRAGRALYQKHCGNCHRLFGEGEAVGPDLTTANRHDRQFLLVSLVDPSSQIRNEYLSHVVQLADGRLLTGRIIDDQPGTVTLLDAKNQRHELSREQIEELHPSPVSLMPENLVEPLSPQELRDLFAYLQSEAPPSEAGP